MLNQTQTQGGTRQGQGARIVGKGSASADGPGPDVMAAATLDGNKVISSDGEDIGKIKDIMLDVGSGRIAYAVLSSGGFLGISTNCWRFRGAPSRSIHKRSASSST